MGLIDKNINNVAGFTANKTDPEYEKKKHILKYVVRCTQLLEGCGQLLEDIGLFTDYPDLEFVWDSVFAFYKQYRQPIPLDALKLDMSCKYDDHLPFTLQQVGEMVQGWYSETGLSPIHVNDMLYGYIKQAKIAELKRELTASPDGIDSQKLKDLATSLQPTISIPEAANPFSGNPNMFLSSVKPIPLGISFIDRMLGGGTVPGETVGFIMPTGGGKTTLVMQGAAECIARNQHVMIAQFEQRLQGDLTKRMYVLAADSSRADWADNDISKVRGDVLQRWRTASSKWQEYLHFYDSWVSNDTPLRSVREIFDVVDRLAGRGQKPEVLFIDWWGRMCTKLEESNRLTSDYDKRKSHQKWLHDIKSYSEDYGIRTFVFHQLAGAEARKSANYVATAHDGMENKNFPQMFDYCFASSRKDSESMVRFRLDKARSTTANQIVAVKLDGERCRFIEKASEFGSSDLIQSMEEEDADTISDFE